MARLYIHAPNIHHGGGAILLIDLIQAIPNNLQAIVSVDTRMTIPEKVRKNIYFESVRPTYLGRLLCEYKLARRTKENDIVLCFGNLPPLFRTKGEISVFLQNRYLVDRLRYLMRLPLRSSLRLFVERIWLVFFKKNARQYFVQTRTMRVLTQKQLGVEVLETPFLSLPQSNCGLSKSKFDFLYVASGEAHKNHKKLVAAWSLLAAEGIFPSLALTLDTNIASELIVYIKNKCAQHGLRINNLGQLSQKEIVDLYLNCDALIYPSDFESFGLPLVEAKNSGLDILAPELDYVRDVIEPQETFDPRSEISIARAIKRYLKVTTKSFEPITSNVFLDKLIRPR